MLFLVEFEAENCQSSKKFKASEEGQRSESKSGVPVGDIDELFLDELEGLSDSEPDADTLSMG